MKPFWGDASSLAGRRLPLLSFCLCLALSSIALAQGEDRQSQAEAVDETLDAEARALFQAGELAFQRGRFQNAMEHFTRAYELSRRPTLLYNIGNAADRLRKDAEALAAFEKYLEAMPDAPNRAAVEARIAVLRDGVLASEGEASEEPGVADEQQADEQQAASQPDRAEPHEETAPLPPDGDETEGAEEAESPTQEADMTGPGALPWVVAGAGLVLAGGGAALLVIGAGQISDVEGAERGSRWSDVEGDADSGPTLATVGAVLVGVGAAGLVTGIIWLASSGGSNEQAPVSMTPGGLCMRGAF